jgi:hypothetical protein
MTQSQSDREQKMFALGLEKLQKQEKEAREKGYATSGPLVAKKAWDLQLAYARLLKREHMRLLGLPRPCELEVMFRACLNQFKVIEETGFDLMERTTKWNGEHFEVDIGFHILAATVWRTICDHAFKPGVGAARTELVAQIGTMVELVIEYYQAIAAREALQRMVGDNKDHELLWLIKHLNRIETLSSDSGSTLANRMGRAKGLLKEVRSGSRINGKRDRGRLLVKRGVQAGIQIIVPEQIQGMFHQPWEDRMRVTTGEALLDLLVRPKLETKPGDMDRRPFYFGGSKGASDRVLPREWFKEELEELQEDVKAYITQDLPLIVPPRPWVYLDKPGIENNSGGYFSPAVRELHPLVRSPINGCLTQPGKLTIALLNKLGQTAWRVDQDQFEMVMKIALEWQKSYDGIIRPLPFTVEELKQGINGAAHLPEVRERKRVKTKALDAKQKLSKLIPLTDQDKQNIRESDANDFKLKMLYRQASKAEKLVKANTSALSRLQLLARDEQFYYAWSADTRLRVYPIGGVATPHGSPMERYSLEFAKGEHLNDDGVKAVMRAIGTAAIDSKVSPLAREQWALDNMNLIRLLGEGTDNAISLAEGLDSPLQLLQLCRQWVKHEAGEMWHAPLYADATNSGWAIVAGLLNDENARNATNICPADESSTPNDAYKIALGVAIGWLKGNSDELSSGGKELPEDWRLQMIDLLDGGLGRKISKAYACTKIYGSSLWTQRDDIKDVLFDNGLTIDDRLIEWMTRLIEKGYRQTMGQVFKYNQMFKRLCQQRLLQGVDKAVAKEFAALAHERSAIQRGFDSTDLDGKTKNRYLKLSREVYKAGADKLLLKLGSDQVDLLQVIQTVERYSTPFHGRPSYFHRHEETVDLADTLKAAPPGLIHYLDGSILKVALAGNREYEVTAVHDSCGCLPNHFEDLLASYRQGYKEVVNPGLLSSIAEQWGCGEIAKEFYTLENSQGTEWLDDVDNFYLMFN